MMCGLLPLMTSLTSLPRAAHDMKLCKMWLKPLLCILLLLHVNSNDHVFAIFQCTVNFFCVYMYVCVYYRWCIIYNIYVYECMYVCVCEY